MALSVTKVLENERKRLNRILICDGYNVFINSFVVNPTMDRDGEHVGGCMGFLGSLNKLIREIKPSEVIVVWDGEGGSLRRRSLFKDYKAGRRPKLNRQYDFESLDQQKVSFRKQLIQVQRYLSMLPVITIRIDGVEADDVIAYICRFERLNTRKVIVSTDRDFYQLLDENTVMYSPRKKVFFTCDDLKVSVGIIPENYIFMKALVGDGSDNIAGLRGFGEKVTMKLFPFLGEREVTLKEILDYAEKHKADANKYSSVIDNSGLLADNVKLMQLSHPEMSPRTTANVRESVRGVEPVYKPFDMKLSFVGDGVAVKAGDFFTNFKEQYHRAKNARKE